MTTLGDQLAFRAPALFDTLLAVTGLPPGS
ncbi:MAG: hypothetical protein ACI8PZ_005976 [Myxococcota bacterium]|jgi:hypothetical protein